MSLLDTIDGAFMNFAYGWAFSKPVRKVFYNITITALSVAVALIIGSIELLAVFADKLSLNGGIWDFVSDLDLNFVGYFIVGLFVVTWVLALAVWRFGRIEERWTARLEPGLETGARSSRQAVTRRSTCRVTRMGEPSFPLSQCCVAKTRCLPRAKSGMRQRTAKRPWPSSTARANTRRSTASTTRGLQNSICAQPVPRTTMRVPALPEAGVERDLLRRRGAVAANSEVATRRRKRCTRSHAGHRR